MSSRTGGRSKADLRTRAFAWYWRRLARNANNPKSLLRLVDRRRAELDEVAARMEAKIAKERVVDTPEEGAVWTLRPECLLEKIAPGALSNPRAGSHFGQHLAIHHDDEGGSFLVSQRPARDAEAGRRFELYFESYEFNGGYMSLSFDVPEWLRRPRSSERLVLVLNLMARWPVRGYVRLNMRGLKGEETLHADAVLGQGETRFPFDLAFSSFELSETDSVWVDLIFDRPRMTEFSILDLSLSLEGDG